MTDYNSPTKPQAERSRVHQLLHSMPGWKRKLLGLSLVVGLVGAGGELASSSLQTHPTGAPNTSTTPVPNVSPADAPPVPNAARGFVSSSGSPAPTPSAPPAPAGGVVQDTAPTMTQRVTPWMTRVGLSFFVGIVVGLIFRMFLKIAMGIVLLIGGAIAALSYFHVLNIDFSSVQTQYASVPAWLSDQLSKLKDVVLHALPSSSSAAVGFFSGFKKH